MEMIFFGTWVFSSLLYSPPIHVCHGGQERLPVAEDTNCSQRSGLIPHCSNTLVMSSLVGSTGLPFVGLGLRLCGCFIFIPLTLSLLYFPDSKTVLIILELPYLCCRLVARTFLRVVLILSKTKQEPNDTNRVVVRLLLLFSVI